MGAALDFIAKMAWPVLIAALVLYFRNQIKDLVVAIIAKMTEINDFSILGAKATFEHNNLLVQDTIKKYRDQFNINIDDKQITNLAEEVAQYIIESPISRSDLLALEIIKDTPGISSDKVTRLCGNRDTFYNMGMLAGLEHGRLITGHLSHNPRLNSLALTDKGRKLVETLKSSAVAEKVVSGE